MATDGSVVNETSGAGSYFPLLHAQYPVRLPDYKPVYDTELIAILMALRRLPAAISKVFIISDCLSAICSLSQGSTSSDYAVLSSLAPAHPSDVLLSWVPGHRGIHENEIADQLAEVALSGLACLLDIAEISHGEIASPGAAQNHETRICFNGLTLTDLRNPWRPHLCHSLQGGYFHASTMWSSFSKLLLTPDWVERLSLVRLLQWDGNDSSFFSIIPAMF